MAGATIVIARGVRRVTVDCFFVIIDECVLVGAARWEVCVGTAHGCAREGGASAQSRRRVNIAERVCLVTMVDEVVLAVETSVGSVAVVLVETGDGGGRGWRGSTHGYGGRASVETFVEVRLGLVVGEAGSRWTGILTAAGLAHLSSGIEVLLKLMISRSIVARAIDGRSSRGNGSSAREGAVVMLRRRHGGLALDRIGSEQH